MNMSNDLLPRRTRKEMPGVERLDARVVPAALHSAAVAAAPAVHTGEAVSDAARGVLRREIRLERLIERREAAVARLEARAARLDARYAGRHPHNASATPAGTVPVTTTSLGGAPPQMGGPGSSGNGSGSQSAGSSTTGTTTLPVSTTTLPVSTTTPTTPVSSPPAGTSGPLPSNVATALDAIYSEYESGTLPTTQSGPGKIEIQGNDVGVMIKVTNPSDFATVYSDVEALGMQVTGSSPSSDTIAGMLPIAQLPAVAGLSDAPIIVPIYGPIAR